MTNPIRVGTKTLITIEALSCDIIVRSTVRIYLSTHTIFEESSKTALKTNSIGVASAVRITICSSSTANNQGDREGVKYT